MRSGRYRITPKWNNRSLIGHLRAGAQEPVNLVFNYGWLLEDVAGKAAQFIEADSTELIQLFYDEEYIKALGYTTETLMSVFIPNTYEFYWNTEAKTFLQ